MAVWALRRGVAARELCLPAPARLAPEVEVFAELVPESPSPSTANASTATIAHAAAAPAIRTAGAVESAGRG